MSVLLKDIDTSCIVSAHLLRQEAQIGSYGIGGFKCCTELPELLVGAVGRQRGMMSFVF